MNESPKPQRSGSLLGLSLDGGRLEGVLLRRTNGAVEILRAFSVTLALNPLTNDAELVGREIRNHLEAAEIRERHCAVCLPLKWALTLQTKLPELPEADVASFLEIDAERGFPYGLDTLALAHSRFRTRGGDQYATQIALPKDHLVRLEKALEAARLTPVTFSLGITALQCAAADSSNGSLALFIGEESVGLQANSGGGVAVLRTLEGALETESGQKRLYADMVARELRITLGQLPADVREGIRRLRIFGPSELADLLAAEIKPRAETLGLVVERVTRPTPGELGVQVPADAAVSPALCLAARQLSGRGAEFEFLPAKVSSWQQLTARYSSKKLLYAGAAASAVALVVLLAFLVQQVQLMRLRSQWSAMAAKTRELDELQQQIKRYRPWFDDSLRSLSILRRLTEAFPEDGSVTAKTIEIRDAGPVICSGTARDGAAFMKVLEQLSAAKEVAEVHWDQLRGTTLKQFTLNFQWGEKAREP